jgi:PiT family inorganic phosphate transporter
LIGPFLLGAAVADTIGGIVTVSPSATTDVIGCALTAAVTWNLVTWWLGLPSSSGHALVGEARRCGAGRRRDSRSGMGRIESGHPVGVFGTLIALAVSRSWAVWPRWR